MIHGGGTFQVVGYPAESESWHSARNRGSGDRQRRLESPQGRSGHALAATAEPMTHLGGTNDLMTQVYDA